MAIYQLGDDVPEIHPQAFVAETATVIGKVHLGERASVWFGTVIRGDTDHIRIGRGSNIQDN
ncbi:MAG TPA: gamma carbonic anhydrase family protein, partial [Burkholderiaceae bacterium]|nr:gamma carbonic anhydrase family protein [Burkholderiaceae bacterium]